MGCGHSLIKLVKDLPSHWFFWGSEYLALGERPLTPNSEVLITIKIYRTPIKQKITAWNSPC